MLHFLICFFHRTTFQSAAKFVQYSKNLVYVRTLSLQCTCFGQEQWHFKLKSFGLLQWLKLSLTELDTAAFWILHFLLWIMIQLDSLVCWVGWFLTTSEPLQNLFSVMLRPTCSVHSEPILMKISAQLQSSYIPKRTERKHARTCCSLCKCRTTKGWVNNNFNFMWIISILQIFDHCKYYVM